MPCVYQVLGAPGARGPLLRRVRRCPGAGRRERPREPVNGPQSGGCHRQSHGQLAKGSGKRDGGREGTRGAQNPAGIQAPTGQRAFRTHGPGSW